MKAAFVTEPYHVEIQDIPCPACRPQEVLIQVKNAGVCGSDLHLFRGTHAFRNPPAILGHEVAGTIVEVGADVSKFKVGDRVTVEPQIGCGQCEFCRNGMVNHCIHKIVPGTDQWLGTFAEYFVAPESVLYPLADSVSFEMGTLIEPLAVTVHAMHQLSGVSKDSILILGAGTIGLLCMTVAKQMGYKTVICTDTAPFNRKSAEKLGAIALDPSKVDVPNEVKRINGGGVDAALIAAGAGNILDQASASVKKRGEICMVAMVTEKIPFYSYSVVLNEQRLVGAMTYSSEHFAMAANMINNGLDLTMFVTQKIDLSQTQEALQMLSEKKGDIIKILMTFSE
ncbi:alcohol dehydrogenase [Anaerotruncus sp. AF02-27]|uniref:zinc-dependent alcohol dehydrogenase n=1 Tax=Anaerotruncus TaxID=244127 RepID=UPI000E4EFBFD|nr:MULTISPECIES: alcohol dehydrogenase catalytic domain-containing protein [Anaerotruncus]RGX54698.1 alcohol dehydrogenase [Anaerotruncus sp. AF02-27]